MAENGFDTPDYATHAVPRKTPERTVQRPVRRVLVVGPKAVYGISPGDTGELELTDGQFRALITAGHIEEAPEDNGSPADTDKDGE